MKKKRLALGLDLSTQGISAVVLDIDARKKVIEHSLDYLKDPRLAGFGIREKDYIVPPRMEGEADQPPQMFLASLDAIFGDLRESGVAFEDIVVINNSGQQHGHIYLNADARLIFAGLQQRDAERSDLVTLLDGCLAYGLAPIWMTSNTAVQADSIRNDVGGKEILIKLSGSDAPLRFTGIVMRRIAQQFPEVYERTENIQLISSLVPAVLTGNSKAPVDFGNACGMSLMDYTAKRWSEPLLRAVSRGLPGGKEALRRKLPELVAPDAVVGTVVAYFVRKYGVNPGCRIAAGSGDNPQSKVPVAGDLLSLGSSFVNMVATDGKTLDMSGSANAMYDGIGKPFMFGCRTNGALVWDRLRALYRLDKEEYASAESALQQEPMAQSLVFWQPGNESFPLSGSFELVRTGDAPPGLGRDYSGLIETSLAAVYYHSKDFAGETGAPLYVTGGATGSPGIMRRVSGIWKRPVIQVEKAGAALGAAIAGVSAFFKSEREEFDVEQFSASILKRGEVIQSRPEDVSIFHRSGGYLDKFAAEEAKLIKAHPLK